MKKWVILLFAAASLTACSDDLITQDQSVLPDTSRALLREHFSELTVDWIKVDKELLRKDTYEVKFTDGTEVDFHKDGSWKEISANKGMIPEALIPLFISDYVEKHYPATKIHSIERTNSVFEVELSNDLSLRFDKQGKMIRLED